MSAALASTAERPGPLRRAWRRFWLAQRVRWAEQDVERIEQQMTHDQQQLEVHAAAIAEWRAEIAFHQEPNREGSR